MVQLVGRGGDEATLLSVSAQLETETGRSSAGRRWSRERAGRAAELGTAVAHEAGAGLREAFGRAVEVSSKSTPTDLVSEADVATERLIRGRLEAARPEDAIMGRRATTIPA